MELEKRRVCGLRILPLCAGLCASLLVTFLLFNHGFQKLWWPLRHLESGSAGVFPLDMSTDSIDDMFSGCRSEVASLIHLFGVFEWNYNGDFGGAWAEAERGARGPAHARLQRDHAVALHMYTGAPHIRRVFNEAVRSGGRDYGTHRFKFHFLYFHLTDAVQALRANQSRCLRAFAHTRRRFQLHPGEPHVRLGTFVWASAHRGAPQANRNSSCFELHTCFGADISHYSDVERPGQVLIPPYEVFKVTQALTDDPRCGALYRLESTRTPRADRNCELRPRPVQTSSAAPLWGGAAAAAGVSLLALCSAVLLRRKQGCFVAAVLGPLLLVAVAAFALSWSDARGDVASVDPNNTW